MITDDAGAEGFEVQGPRGFSGKLSLRDPAGVEVAAISRQGLGSRYEIRTAEDPVLMLAVVLVIETIRANRRAAAASG